MWLSNMKRRRIRRRRIKSNSDTIFVAFMFHSSFNIADEAIHIKKIARLMFYFDAVL